MPAFKIESDDHWKILRAKHIGGSDAAAILGISKRRSIFSIYMEKSGKLPAIDLDDIRYIRNGKLFEPSIASVGSETFGVQVRKVRRYIEADDCPALGVTCDYEEIGGGRLCPVEIKWSEVGMGWEWDGNVITAAPDDNVIQVQAQLACMPNAPYGRLWAFIQGDVREMVVERRPAIIDAIKEASTKFMADVAAGNEPPVDYSVDSEDISRLALLKGLEQVDWTDDEAGRALLKEYRDAQQAEKAAEEMKKVAKSKIFVRLIDHAVIPDMDQLDKVVISSGGLKTSLSKIAANPGKIITQEMVGEVLGAKAGHIRMVVNEVKGK